MENQIKILIIDDDLNDLELIRGSLLIRKDYIISTATSLAAAKQLIRDTVFDATILDLSLPDASGMQAFDVIKDEKNAGALIINTGLENHVYALNAIRSGAQSYLVKGKISPSMFMEEVEFSIERSRIIDHYKEREMNFKIGIVNPIKSIINEMSKKENA